MDSIVPIFTVTGSWCVVACVLYAGIKSFERVSLARWNVERTQKELERVALEGLSAQGEADKMAQTLATTVKELDKVKSELEKMKQLPTPRPRF